jgi:hypothetical protein
LNLDGSDDYLSMLKRQTEGEIDSSAIRRSFPVVAFDGLALFPPRTLVSSTGLDRSATHDRLALAAHQSALETHASFDFPTEVAESGQKAQVFDAISAFRPSSTRRRLTPLIGLALRIRSVR